MMGLLREEIDDILVLFYWMIELECFTMKEIIEAISQDYQVSIKIVKQIIEEELDD